jgi:hypothetical protein
MAYESLQNQSHGFSQRAAAGGNAACSTAAAFSCLHQPKPLPSWRSTYDIMWRESIMQLLEQLEAENPEDATLAPKVRASLRRQACAGLDQRGVSHCSRAGRGCGAHA